MSAKKPKTIPTKYVQWLLGDDTGLSSITIWAVMMGVENWGEGPLVYPSVPYDPGDFGRCHRLLKKFPEWRPRLPEVAARYPHWTRLVEKWDRLDALYKSGTSVDGALLYHEIQEAIYDRP